MEYKDIIVSAFGFLFVGYIVWMKFKERPSDKYHNDSWRNNN